MKVNIIGRGHANSLAEMLTMYGHTADLNSPNTDYYDYNLCMGLWELPRHPTKNLAVYLMGSDIWRDLDTLDLTRLQHTKLILYPHRDMLVRLAEHTQPIKPPKVTQWRMPVNTKLFYIHVDKKRELRRNGRDVLFYAPSPTTYKLDKILEWVESDDVYKFTLIGGAYTNFISGEPPENLLIVPSVPYHNMPQMYARHKEFRCYWTHPGWCLKGGVMNFEARLMGLESYWNDQPAEPMPDHVRMENAVPCLIKHLENINGT